MANPISNFFDKMISSRVEKAVQDELSKQASSSPIIYSGASKNIGIGGTSEKPGSRGVSFNVLRNLANYYPIARACVNYLKTQMAQLDWDISVLSEEQEEGSKKLSDKDKATTKELKNFFKYPTGDKTVTFRRFMATCLEDVLVIDALALYRRKKKIGNTFGYLPIDGATIKLRVNDDGTVPEPPETAYIQVINGKQVAELTTEDMIYGVMNPRTITPYGMAPLETLVVTVSTALRLQSYNLSYLTEGNVPEGFVELPKDVASSPQQLEKWQKTWDAMMAGDPRAMSRLRFLPEGMKYTPTKKAEDMSFERFERWLLQNTCAGFGVPPQNIGFTYEVNKATGEVQWQVGREKGLTPLATFMKEIYDQIIQDDMGYENFEFVWTNLNPTNAKEEADVFSELVDKGAVSVDEWRAGEGLAPIGLGHYIKTSSGIVLVKNFLANGGDTSQNAQTGGQGNQVPADQLTEVNPKDLPKEITGGAKQNQTPKEQTNASVGGQQVPTGKLMKFSNNELASDDLKKWKRVAIHDLERGKPMRDFKTDSVDDRVKSLIKEGLKKVSTTKEITELFDPFLSPESRIISAVLDLYDDLGEVLER